MVSTPCLSCHFLQNIRQLKSLGRLHYRLRRNCTLLDGFRRQGSRSSRVHVEVATFGEEGEVGRGKREEKAGSAQGWVLWGHVPAASPGMGLPPSLCVCMPLWWHMQNQFLGFSARNSIVLSFLLGNIRKAGKKTTKPKKTPVVSYLGESCKAFLICKMRQKEERLFMEELDFTSGDSGEPGQISFFLCREKWPFSFGGKLWGKIINLHRAINRI